MTAEMKKPVIFILVLKLLYGTFVTLALVFLVHILDGLSGWGDGITHSSQTPQLFWLPIGLYFGFSAFISTFSQTKRIRTVSFPAAFIVLYFVLSFIVGGGNAIFLCVPIGVLSLLMWLPLQPRQKESGLNNDDWSM